LERKKLFTSNSDELNRNCLAQPSKVYPLSTVDFVKRATRQRHVFRALGGILVDAVFVL
jgi:hypothetical protein